MSSQTTKELAKEFFVKLFYGEHHFPSQIKQYGVGWSIACTKPIATTDYNDLTRLVIMAHDMCLRAEIVPKGMNRYLIVVSQRERGPELMTQHADIDSAIKSCREFNARRFPEMNHEPVK